MESVALCGVGSDERVHNGSELFAFIFLKEVAATNNGGVCLAGRTRNLTLKVLVAASRDGVAVAERSEEWFCPRPQDVPRSLVCDIRRVVFSVRVQRRKDACSGFE